MNPPQPRRHSGAWLLGWAEQHLAADTFARTFAAAEADLQLELERADPPTRRRLARAARWQYLRILGGALAIDRREARRGLRWWLLFTPLLAVMTGLFALGDGLAPIAQLAFAAAGLVAGYVMASTPRRILASEAPAAGWIAIAMLAALPLIGRDLHGSARWLAIGPLVIQVSTLVMPVLALALSALVTRGRLGHALALSASGQLALAATADLTGAVTLAVITLAIALTSTRRALLPLSLTTLPLVGIAALRDPLLAPVAHSEGALAELHPLLMALALLALCLAIAAPLTTWSRTTDAWPRALAAALALGVATPLACGLLFPAPVPLVGFGGSAIVACHLGLGALLALERVDRPRAARATM